MSEPNTRQELLDRLVADYQADLAKLTDEQLRTHFESIKKFVEEQAPKA